MTDNRSYLQKYAMHFGTLMGVYWILKFILFPLGFQIPFLLLLFTILTLAVPFLGYYYGKMYRDKICGGSIQFSHAALFSIFMYMFASLLVAVAHYIYFRFIDHGSFANFYIKLLDNLTETNSIQLKQDKEITANISYALRSLTPADFTLNFFSGNVIVGSLLAIPTALMLTKRANPQNNGMPQS